MLTVNLISHHTISAKDSDYNSKYINAKLFCQKHGYRIGYSAKKEEIEIIKNKKNVKMLIGSNIVIINGNEIYNLSNPIIKKNGIVYFPNDLEEYISNTKIINNKTVIKFNNKSNHNSNNETKTLSYQNDYSSDIKDANKINFVFIDAGHGGKDPGFCNPEQTRLEKEVTFPISVLLAKEVKRICKDVRPVLTRTDDSYIYPGDRSDMAIKISGLNGNGIFVSIHANASIDEKSYGIETFYYTRGPTDDIPKITTYREKYIEERFTNRLSSKQDVKAILNHMLDIQLTKESKLLAEYVNNSVCKHLNKYTDNRGIKTANFMVNAYINMPSILIEIGFLTNKVEGQRLYSNWYQNKLAKGIAKGIKKFINEFNKTNSFTN